jgi:hypothetical protein
MNTSSANAVPAGLSSHEGSQAFPVAVPGSKVMSEERRSQQAKFITDKLNSKRITMFNKYGLTFHEDNETIVRSTMGELRNTVLAFFKGGLFKEKRCEHCGKIGGSQMRLNRSLSATSCVLS